jgi:hypothetical protein
MFLEFGSGVPSSIAKFCHPKRTLPVGGGELV